MRGEIHDLKTRDQQILKETIKELFDKNIYTVDLSVIFEAVEKLNCDTHLLHSREYGEYIFTNMYDEDMVYQEFFNNLNFVIVESDPWMAMARGVHYLYHKRIKP